MTSQALQEPLPLNDQPRKARKSLSIEHATLHNLNNLSVEVPLGVLTVICGVAGSGKSSLAEEIYQKAQADNQEIIHLSQKSITANLRSTPMTYLNIFDKVANCLRKKIMLVQLYLAIIPKAPVLLARGKA